MSHKSRSSQAAPDEGHDGGGEDGNWIMSYADMMTLLVGFFALLYSFSQVDKQKFEKLREAISKQFGGRFETPFEDLDEALKSIVMKADLKDKVRVEKDAGGISIIFQGSVFFDSGSTDLKLEAKPTLERIIEALKHKAQGFPIVVEGHTDNTPINTVQFPSNWELSASRAARVIRLFEEKGFERASLQTQGFADTKPLVPNDAADGTALLENRARNRRVVIRVTRR